jgi:hypothetical protein
MSEPIEVEATEGEIETTFPIIEEESPDWVDLPEDLNNQIRLQNRFCFWYLRRQASVPNKVVRSEYI